MSVALQKQFPRLSLKQRRFVEHLVRTGNGVEAVGTAGYQSKNPGRRAAELRALPQIAAAIEDRMKEELELVGIETHRVLKELSYIGLADIAQLYATQAHVDRKEAKEVGEILPARFMPESVRRAISAIKVSEIVDPDGTFRGFTTEVKFWNKNDALEKIGKYLKLWVDAANVNINAQSGSVVNVGQMGVIVLPPLKD